MATDQKLATCLWFDGRAEEAAKFYVSLFPDSAIVALTRGPSDWPGGKAGDVILVSFTLFGQSFQALNGGPFTEFNESVSLSVTCSDQTEVDRYWEALTADGGAPIMCGWLKDRFGLRWQIVPQAFIEMMQNPDQERVTRMMAAMHQMVKLDIAALERAFEG